MNRDMLEIGEPISGEHLYKRLFTVDEFEAFIEQPAQIEFLYELIHGEIVEKMPTEEHGIALNIASPLKTHVKQHKLGKVGVEVRYRTPNDQYNVRQPDISFRANPDSPVVKCGSVMQMPDLAVEVKSPTDTYKAMRERAEYLLQNGCWLVWLVYPEKQMVEVCTHSAEHPNTMLIRTLTIDDTLDGGDVLPGFTLAIRDIFDMA